MSHPLFFRGVTHFYPVGNTSAVCLTEHLPPEQDAHILLLACGDPRHILHTVHSNTNETDADVEPQKLDVTCCDVEAAVLARNAILFTLLADEGAQGKLDHIWNIFYHFVLDPESLALLLAQCRKLVALAQNLDTWHAGPYARFLTACDEYTLAELRRFWNLYLATADDAPDRRTQFKNTFFTGMKDVVDKLGDGVVLTSSRSAGPLLPLAIKAVAEQFRQFWSTGITDDGLHSTEQATRVNPTFVFSMAGDAFAVHYGVDPVAGFHLAEVVATTHQETTSLLAQKLVGTARHQFSQWCTSVINRLKGSSKLVIRMFAGDALSLCQAFSHLNLTGVPATPILSAPWSASTITFEESQYGDGASMPAPTMFNVIDTSNISDHIGLLNLLVVTIPLLSKSFGATLYTEGLFSHSDTPSLDILERLCGDMQTMSLFLGVVPVTFLSRFTTRSNVHEMLLQVFKGTQYHERMAWKALDSESRIAFAPEQLSRFLFQVYLNMFANENVARRLQHMSVSSPHAQLEATLVHYTRRSFVQLLRHIKSRVQTDWTQVMMMFDDQVMQDGSLMLGSNLYQEMCCHLHVFDIVTFTSMEQSFVQSLHAQSNSALFRNWDSIPPVVTVVLVVPRSKITAVESDLRLAKTPVFQCEIRNPSLWNIFMDIHAAYGRLDTTGTGHTKTAIIMEEKQYESTSAPLIVFFSVPSSSLLLSHDAVVGFRTRPSLNMARQRSLGEPIFTAPLDDARRVHLLAEPPLPRVTRSTTKAATDQVGQRVLNVHMNEACTEIRTFGTRVDITDPAGQSALAAGSSVKLKRTPTHGARLCIDDYSEKLNFPLPVDVANTTFRVARKSKYIDVISPLALSMHVQNERDVANRFFTVCNDGVPTSWDVHRVNLHRCPPFNPSVHPGAATWLVPHVTLMFSHRERALRHTNPSLDPFVNLKDSLQMLLLSAAGANGPTRSVFTLCDAAAAGHLAVLVVGGVRFDVGAHTVLADAWVVPGTTAVQEALCRLEVRDVVAIMVDAKEWAAWRRLLPVFVERCRTWAHRAGCAYLVQDEDKDKDKDGDGDGWPSCGCGEGVGAEVGLGRFACLAPYATRLALSPLFAVPYLEEVGMPTDKDSKADDGPADGQERCRACGKRGGSLAACGRCKRVRYCSKACQVGDWKLHKKACAK